jgi:hypothetical protein
MNLRKIAGFASAIALAAPVSLMLGSGSATGAVTTYQKCGILTGTATISPGLSTVPRNQTITATGALKNCLPKAATGGSGKLTATVKLANGSCQGLASGTTLPLKGNIKWINGKVSGLTVTAKTTSSDPTAATMAGKVTSGLFVNRLANGKIRFSIVSGDCSSKPVTKISFTNKLSSSQTVPFTIHS